MATTTAEQIEELQQQIARLKDRNLLELRVKLAEARGVVADLETELRNLTGSVPSPTAKIRRAKSSFTIEDVVEAIKAGAINYRTVATKLSAPPAAVAKKIQAEGAAAGIFSTGKKANFRLGVK